MLQNILLVELPDAILTKRMLIFEPARNRKLQLAVRVETVLQY